MKNYFCGLGLRKKYWDVFAKENIDIPYVELYAESVFDLKEKEEALIEKLKKEGKKITLHGSSLSLASDSPPFYLEKIKKSLDTYDFEWFSDHLCFSGSRGSYFNNLFPFPYNSESLKYIVRRVKNIQDYLGRNFALENLGAFINFSNNEMMELDFISEVVNKTDCWVLFDVSNAYVSANNNNYDLIGSLHNFPIQSIIELHLGGYKEKKGFLIDSHDRKISANAWCFYEKFIKEFGEFATIIEWDVDLPEFDQIFKEVELASSRLNNPSLSFSQEIEINKNYNYNNVNLGNNGFFEYNYQDQIDEVTKYICYGDEVNSLFFIGKDNEEIKSKLLIYREAYLSEAVNFLENVFLNLKLYLRDKIYDYFFLFLKNNAFNGYCDNNFIISFYEFFQKENKNSLLINEIIKFDFLVYKQTQFSFFVPISIDKVNDIKKDFIPNSKLMKASLSPNSELERFFYNVHEIKSMHSPKEQLSDEKINYLVFFRQLNDDESILPLTCEVSYEEWKILSLLKEPIFFSDEEIVLIKDKLDFFLKKNIVVFNQN